MLLVETLRIKYKIAVYRLAMRQQLPGVSC
jgi:hypothetical protein